MHVGLIEWVAVGLVALLALLAGSVALAWRASTALLRRRAPDSPIEPAALGLEAEAVSFESRDRHTALRGWWIAAPHAKGTVVVCSGQRGSLDGDLPVFGPLLHEAGYNTLFFDWRAHGRSDGEFVSFGVYEKEDLLGALDFLGARGVTRVGLLGLSMGGSVALIAAALTERVAAVVCDSLPVHIQNALTGYVVARGVPRLLADIGARLVLVIASFRVGGNLFHTDAWRWAPHVGATPVLLIHGDRDPLVSVDEIERVFTLLPGPKVLWRVPTAGHREAYSARPEEYTRRVLAWFDEHL